MLPRSLRKLGNNRHTWLSITTPDLGLLRKDGAPEGDTNYALELCLAEPRGDETSLVPVAAVLFEANTRAATLNRDPMLIQLGAYERRDGFQVPSTLKLHLLDAPQAGATPRFKDAPAQEVYVLELDLRPELSAKDFKP